jgi:hypothetical protein
VTAPWWTAADQAELELLWAEWVDGAFEHRDRCAACIAHERVYGKQWCDALRESLEIVLDWRERRSLYSYVVEMRRLQDLADLKTEAPGSTANRTEAA